MVYRWIQDGTGVRDMFQVLGQTASIFQVKVFGKPEEINEKY